MTANQGERDVDPTAAAGWGRRAQAGLVVLHIAGTPSRRRIINDGQLHLMPIREYRQAFGPSQEEKSTDQLAKTRGGSTGGLLQLPRTAASIRWIGRESCSALVDPPRVDSLYEPSGLTINDRQSRYGSPKASSKS